MYTRFTNCHLIDNGQLYEFTDLYIDQKTRTICEKPSHSVTKTIDLQGQILAPGFLDIQNNGIYGLNFSNLNSDSTDADIASFQKFYQDAMTKYLSTGVTGLCPTVTSNFSPVYDKVLPLYKKTRSSTHCDSLGAHLEGPFININKKGCHPVETFVDAKEGDCKLTQVYGDNFENVCIITAAPEIDGVLDLIPLIKSKDCVYSIGHTMSDYETGKLAIDQGCTMITHLYNAMPQPHHRNVGVVGLINSPEVNSPYYGLICDGVHIDPSMVNFAYKSNPSKCILVTDAMHLIGLPDGRYKWDEQVIVKTGDRLYLENTDTLAGASTTLPQCVRNLMKWANISLPQAIKTVTNNPATSIGVQNQRGYLNVGCVADFVVLNKKGFVTRVYKLGNEVKSSDVPETTRISAVL